MNFFIRAASQRGRGYNPEETTAEGKEVFWIIGDSIAFGTNNSGGPGPTPAAGTVYEATGAGGSTIVEVGASDLAGVNTGSPWPQMGITYNAASSRKPVFVNSGSPGAEFSPNGDTTNWSATGTLRGTGQTKVAGALTALGLTRPKAIIVILGINDARAATTLSTVQSDVNAFFTWLTGLYPDTDILVAQIGIATSTTTARIAAVRNYIRTAVEANEKVNFCGNLGSFYPLGYYGVDALHPTQTGNNEVGKQFARWLGNSAYSKWARSIISTFYDDISTSRKQLIDTNISAYLSDFLLLDNSYVFKNTIEANVFVDWSFLAGPLDSGFGFTANDSISSNGSSTYFRSNYQPSFANFKASQNDLCMGIKIKTNSTAAGTIATAAGSLDGSGAIAIGQITTGGNQVQFRANDFNALNYNTDTKMQDDTLYTVARNGTTKRGLKNAVEVSTTVAASTVNVTANPFIGSLNGSGTASQFINATFEYYYFGKESTINHANIMAMFENIINGW